MTRFSDMASRWTVVRRYASASLGSTAQTSASFYDSTIERYASQPVEVLSLGQMLQFGRNAATQPEKILKSARFVQREIPKRLARRLLDLQLLPYIVVTNPHIKDVYDNYLRSFNVLRQLPPVNSIEDNMTFSQIMRTQLDQHAPMLDALATGLREVKGKQLVGRCLQLDAFFDSMLSSRISRRVIAEQHLQLTDKRPGYIGIISTDLDIADAVDLAAQKTRQVCMETYGTAPEVLVSGDVTARLPYISAHLDYMLYELLKNAARAVVEQHSTHSHPAAPGAHSWHHHPTAATPRHSHPLGALPPIHVRICAGQHSSDLTIKVSDQGGGIPTYMIDKVWSYGFTTVGGVPAGYDLDHPSLPAASGGAGGARAAAGAWPGAVGQEDGAAAEERLGAATAVAAAGGRMGAGVAAAAGAAGRAAAAVTGRSQWIGYSPSGVASGPYAPQPLIKAAADGGAGGGASVGGDAGGLHREGLGSGMHGPGAGGVSLMGDGPGGGRGGAGRFRMAGLGFGLPLSRLYARYFGGELTLQVVPGYGTDAYLTIRGLEGEWKERMYDPAVMPVDA